MVPIHGTGSVQYSIMSLHHKDKLFFFQYESVDGIFCCGFILFKFSSYLTPPKLDTVSVWKFAVNYKQISEVVSFLSHGYLHVSDFKIPKCFSDVWVIISVVLIYIHLFVLINSSKLGIPVNCILKHCIYHLFQKWLYTSFHFYLLVLL